MLLIATLVAFVVMLVLATIDTRPRTPHALGLDLTTEDARTIRVNRVTAETVGGQMGLQPGDRILAVNGSPAASPWAVRNAVLAGTPTVLHIGRGEQRLRSEITFANTGDLTPTVATVHTTPLA